MAGTWTRAALVAATVGIAALAQAAPDLPEIKQSAQVDTLTMGGDFRMREEYFDFKDKESATWYTGSKNDRSRQRFRLRVKSDYKLKDDFTVTAGLASGGGEAVSTNQSFAGTAQQKAIWIDLAYVAWTPGYLGDNGSLKLQTGRMANALWRIYTSDLVWDGDFNPEGFAESGSYLLMDSVNVFVNAQQLAINEVGNDPRDPWEVSEQIGLEAPLPLGLRVKGAVAKHTWLNENSNVFGQNPIQTGNTRSNGFLINEYDVNELTGQLSGWIPVPGLEQNIPFVLMGTLINNAAARGPQFSGSVTGGAAGVGGAKYVKADGKTFLGRSNQGLQVGAQIGVAKEPNSWEIAWFYKRVDWDATVADVSDSDFGEGGLNRKGNIMYANYTPNGFVTFGFKWFNNLRWLDKRYVTAGGKVSRPDRMDRFQLDLSVKF